MRLTEVLLQGARINPLIYETISTCWIFTDSFFEANGWLTLYRESEYDDEFKNMAYEYWGPELRYLREIFIHFRLGHTGLSQSWVPCFNSPVYNAVQRGYIKVYKLDKGKQFRSSQELSVASHPIWSQHLQREYVEGSINQLRATFACALSESLDGRWYDRDVENRMLYNQGFGTRMAYRLGHTAKGAADSVVESLQELIHIGVVLFKGAQAGYRAYLELRHDIDEKGAAAITERMHALGVKIEQGVDKVTALIKQGLSMLNTILSDPYCRGYLFEYFDGLKESISELGRCRMIGGFIGEVGLTFIIALATGGIGLIPRAAQLIGGLSYKVLKVMLKIYDALQEKAAKVLEARMLDLYGDYQLNRSIAPKVPEEHKLKQEKETSDKQTLQNQVSDEVNIARERREQSDMPISADNTTVSNRSSAKDNKEDIQKRSDESESLKVYSENSDQKLKPKKIPNKTDRLKKHILNGELDAARREAAGEVVARKDDGTPWDHVTELRDAQRGLMKRINSINKKLSSNKIDDSTRSMLEDELSEASLLLDKTEGYLPRK